MQALQFNVTVPKFIAAKTLRALFGNQAFYKGPSKTIELVEIPEPDPPGPDWVKIRTRYCGFCGSDLNLLLLHDSPTASPFTSFPCIMGHEIIGEIVSVGADADDFAVGERVAVNPILACAARGISTVCPCCRAGKPGNCENFTKGKLAPGMFLGINSGVSGGFAPFLVAHRSQLFKIPEGVADEAAVMTEPLAVALQALFDNMPTDGENVLLIGGGVIGNLILQAIRALGVKCRVAVIEPSAFAVEMARKAGADDCIPFKSVFREAARITGATVFKPMLGMEVLMGGFHRIYDTVGNGATLNLSMRLLAGLGTLSVVGIGGDVKLDLTPLWLKLQTVKGVYAYGQAIWNGREQHVFDIALELLQAGRIDAASLVTHTFALADYRRMIEVNLNKGAHNAFKTVVSFP